MTLQEQMDAAVERLAEDLEAMMRQALERAALILAGQETEEDLPALPAVIREAFRTFAQSQADAKPPLPLDSIPPEVFGSKRRPRRRRSITRAPRPADLAEIIRINGRAVHEAVRVLGRPTEAEIGEKIHLAPNLVRAVLGDLIKRKIVAETSTSRGREYGLLSTGSIQPFRRNKSQPPIASIAPSGLAGTLVSTESSRLENVARSPGPVVGISATRTFPRSECASSPAALLDPRITEANDSLERAKIRSRVRARVGEGAWRALSLEELREVELREIEKQGDGVDYIVQLFRERAVAMPEGRRP